MKVEPSDRISAFIALSAMGRHSEKTASMDQKEGPCQALGLLGPEL